MTRTNETRKKHFFPRTFLSAIRDIYIFPENSFLFKNPRVDTRKNNMENTIKSWQCSI